MSAVRKGERSMAKERPSISPHPNTKKKKLKKKRKHAQVEYIKFNTRMYRIPLHIIFTVFLIFAGGVGTAVTFAYLQDMRRQIEGERNLIHQQRVTNNALRAEIAQHLTIDEIARIAREDLNMGPADASQIVRINVPRQSYVVQSAAPAQTEPQGMWQSALWHIRNWLGV